MHQYKPALALIESLLSELKRLDDKLVLTEVHLLESRVHRGTANLPKSKVCSSFCCSTRPWRLIQRSNRLPSHPPALPPTQFTAPRTSKRSLTSSQESCMLRTKTTQPRIRTSLRRLRTSRVRARRIGRSRRCGTCSYARSCSTSYAFSLRYAMLFRISLS